MTKPSLLAFFLYSLGFSSGLFADVEKVLTENYKAIDLESDPVTRYLSMECRINGKSGPFLIDLRATRTTVALESLEKFSLKKGPVSGKDLLPAGGTTDRFQVATSKFSLADCAHFTTKSIMASQQHGTEGAAEGSDGKLGAEFMGYFKGCIIDYSTQRFYFSIPEPNTTFDSAMEQVDFSSLELGVNGADRDFVAQINGKDAHFLIDTRSPDSFIIQEQLKANDLTAAIPPKDSSLPQVTTIDSLKFGTTTFTNLPLRVVSSSGRKLNSPARKISGIIGSDLLTEGGAIIDYTNKTIYFPAIEVHGSEISSFVGGFPFNQKIIQQVSNSSESIFTGTLSESRNLNKITKMKDQEYLIYGLVFTQNTLLKGQPKKTQVIKVRFKSELGEEGIQKIIDQKFAQKNNGWIIFKNRHAILELDQAVFRDSALRRAQLGL